MKYLLLFLITLSFSVNAKEWKMVGPDGIVLLIKSCHYDKTMHLAYKGAEAGCWKLIENGMVKIQ